MADARQPIAIDRELAVTVTRRRQNRAAISSLSQSVVNDTRRIDQLLAERAAATLSPRPAAPSA